MTSTVVVSIATISLLLLTLGATLHNLPPCPARLKKQVAELEARVNKLQGKRTDLANKLDDTEDRLRINTQCVMALQSQVDTLSEVRQQHALDGRQRGICDSPLSAHRSVRGALQANRLMAAGSLVLPQASEATTAPVEATLQPATVTPQPSDSDSESSYEGVVSSLKKSRKRSHSRRRKHKKKQGGRGRKDIAPVRRREPSRPTPTMGRAVPSVPTGPKRASSVVSRPGGVSRGSKLEQVHALHSTCNMRHHTFPTNGAMHAPHPRLPCPAHHPDTTRRVRSAGEGSPEVAQAAVGRTK